MSVPNSLTRADALVLRHLLRATDKDQLVDNQDGTASLQFLTLANDPSQSQFQPTVFTSWDLKDLDLSGFINRVFLTRYISWAQGVVRNPTDVVFVTHTLLYLSTLVPSALYLFYRFSWTHALLHWLMEAYSCGPFTIMLHNHIHNDGVLDRKYSVLDRLIPYVLEPLMGHTWDSYYYHHVKHHHVENNGPDDLSSTLRYQRDSPVDFLIYLGRFAFLIWIELPLYFFTKRKYSLAIKSFMSEFSSMMMIFCLTRYNFNAGLIVLILPLVQMRIGMMLGNWGQHAFVDEADPTSNYRSSITLIDAQVCFFHTLLTLDALGRRLTLDAEQPVLL